jgi:hypothetical protein
MGSSVSRLTRPEHNRDLPRILLRHRNLSDSEREAREALWRFHETAERLEMLRLAVPSSAGVEQLMKEYSKRKSRLEASPFFQSLPKRQRTNLLNARDSKFSSKSEIADRAGISRRYLASCYKYCSNFTHTSPMSVAMMNAFRAGTPEATERFKYVSDLATAFLALTIRDFVRLVPDHGTQIDDEIWDVIRMWEGTLKDWDMRD